MVKLTHRCVAEALGSFFIVFMGCGAIMVTERFGGVLPHPAVALSFGLIVAALIYGLGHISGAHFNPAVTLAFSLARHFPPREIIPYWFAQFSGALIASVVLGMLLPIGDGFGATLPHVSTFQAVGWEAMLTFLLMFVVMAVATDTRAVGFMAGAAIGAVVCLDALVGGPLTGASMNPARSFGPAVLQGELGSLWIYFVGPAVGAVSAAFLYEWIRCGGKKCAEATEPKLRSISQASPS
jgi:aquaporin NIP